MGSQPKYSGQEPPPEVPKTAEDKEVDGVIEKENSKAGESTSSTSTDPAVVEPEKPKKKVWFGKGAKADSEKKKSEEKEASEGTEEDEEAKEAARKAKEAEEANMANFIVRTHDTPDVLHDPGRSLNSLLYRGFTALQLHWIGPFR